MNNKISIYIYIYIYITGKSTKAYIDFFSKSLVFVPCFWLWTLRAKRECRDENVFFKVEVILRKFNSHSQYYEIDLSFSLKLKEINLNVYEEHKNEREARDESVHAKQADFFF